MGETFDRHRIVDARSGCHVLVRAEPENRVEALLVSFGVIFVAELGDKSQLMALAFAARFRPLPILIGIAVATGVVHALSVVIGAVVGAALPTREVNVIAGAAFFAFAAWTVRGERLGANDAVRAERTDRSALVGSAGAFFLAELGDKTMLATITLASTGNVFGVWVGSTLGMVAADALAILAGASLGRRLPERAVRVGAALSFVAFGVLLIVEGLA